MRRTALLLLVLPQTAVSNAFAAGSSSPGDPLRRRLADARAVEEV
jgi:hypothetical protein